MTIGAHKVQQPTKVYPIPDRRMIVVPDQDCIQCGRCCEKWGWGQKGVIEDLLPWIQENRQDILKHVSVILKDKKRRNGRDISKNDLAGIVRIDYWVSPDGRALTHCPFYQRGADGKVYCAIHRAKPRVCVGFEPWNEGIRDYALNCPACRNTAP
jgi:Fe-S-cluster containining protein